MKIRFAPLLSRLALAVVLVAGQLAAQGHLYSHLRFVPELSDHGGTGTAYCNDCLAFAPLLSPGGVPQAVPLPPDLLTAVIPASTEAVRHSPRLIPAFRSRAPPAIS